MASTYTVIKFTKDYADEFDVYGTIMYPTEKWNAKKLELDIFFSQVPESIQFETCFGTNEFLEFSSASDVIDSVEEVVITEEESKVFTQIFEKSFGYLPTLFYEGKEWSF